MQLLHTLLSDHVAAVCRSGYDNCDCFVCVLFAWRQQDDGPGFRRQMPGLMQRAVLHGITGELWSVQNAAARLLTGTRQCDQSPI